MSRILTVTPNSALDLWITTEHLRSGQKLRASAPRLYPGGGGVNVSRVIHRLGGDTLALFTAGGWTGDEVAAALEREQVPSRRVKITGTSRQDLNLCEEDSGDVYRVILPGPELSDSEQKDIIDQAASLAGENSIVIGSGSLPAGTKPSFWSDLIGRMKQAGVKFVLDSASQATPEQAKGVWLLRKNKNEIVEIVGRELDWPGGIADWGSSQIEKGFCEVVIVTHGGEGALMVTRDRRVRIASPKVKVNSAIGAGDSFMGALCLAFSQGKHAEDALRLAVAAAAATVLTPGTELCRSEDVHRLVGECGEPEAL